MLWVDPTDPLVVAAVTGSDPEAVPSDKEIDLVRVAVAIASEVLTLAIFGQWQGFGSERGFYRYAQHHLRPAFPTLPARAQFNRQLRLHSDALLACSMHVARQLRAGSAPTRPWTAPRCRPATPSGAAPDGCRASPISAGAVGWAGSKASA